MGLNLYHVYHNNCAPRFYDNLKDALDYAESLMQSSTNGYTGTKYISEKSVLKISYHKFMRRNDPNQTIVYDNMYNLNRIIENNKLYSDRQIELEKNSIRP
jgi:hypothetical protein